MKTMAFLLGVVAGAAAVTASRIRVVKVDRPASPVTVEEFDELWDTAKGLNEDRGLKLLGEVLEDIFSDSWQEDLGEEDG